MIPPGWSDDGKTLTAPNKNTVVLGFRQHILDAASWSSDNVPLLEEYSTSQVLLHNASVGAGQVQLFEKSMLWWTAKLGVVEESQLGSEIAAAYALIASQQAQIAALKAAQPAGTAVDTTQVEDDIHILIDSLPPLFAKLLVDVKKL